jgi:hypothetical protein
VPAPAVVVPAGTARRMVGDFFLLNCYVRHRYASLPVSSAACSRPSPMRRPTWSSESE